MISNGWWGEKWGCSRVKLDCWTHWNHGVRHVHAGECVTQAQFFDNPCADSHASTRAFSWSCYAAPSAYGRGYVCVCLRVRACMLGIYGLLGPLFTAKLLVLCEFKICVFLIPKSRLHCRTKQCDWKNKGSLSFITTWRLFGTIDRDYA